MKRTKGKREKNEQTEKPLMGKIQRKNIFILFTARLLEKQAWNKMSRERKGKWTSGKFAKRIIKKKLFNYINDESESESSGGSRMFWKHKMHQAAVTLILADSVSGTSCVEQERASEQGWKLSIVAAKHSYRKSFFWMVYGVHRHPLLYFNLLYPSNNCRASSTFN